jgi:hypothetical protein
MRFRVLPARGILDCVEQGPTRFVMDRWLRNVLLVSALLCAALIVVFSEQPENTRDSDPTFFSLKGAACGRFLTADEKLEWERVNKFETASAQQMAKATCQQLAAMLDSLDAKPEAADGDCFSQMNSLENDVWSTLSWHSTARLDKLPCASERRVLDVLADVPKDYRDEQVDRLFDRASGR